LVSDAAYGFSCGPAGSQHYLVLIEDGKIKKELFVEARHVSFWCGSSRPVVNNKHPYINGVRWPFLYSLSQKADLPKKAIYQVKSRVLFSFGPRATLEQMNFSTTADAAKAVKETKWVKERKEQFDWVVTHLRYEVIAARKLDQKFDQMHSQWAQLERRQKLKWNFIEGGVPILILLILIHAALAPFLSEKRDRILARKSLPIRLGAMVSHNSLAFVGYLLICWFFSGWIIMATFNSWGLFGFVILLPILGIIVFRIARFRRDLAKIKWGQQRIRFPFSRRTDNDSGT